MTALPTALDQRFAFVPAGDEELFVILTRPHGADSGVVVVLLSGGGLGATPHKNRMFVRLAALLAERGFWVLRMDYHGCGESTGEAVQVRLNEPFVHDVQAVVDWLGSLGLVDIVLAGNCFGARTALAVAPLIERLHGVALLTPPVRDNTRHNSDADGSLTPAGAREVASGLKHQIRRLGRKAVARARVSRGGSRDSGRLAGASASFLVPFAAVLDRGIPVLAFFGDEDPYLLHWNRAIVGSLGQLVSAAGAQLSIVVAPGRAHGYATVGIQDAAVDAVDEWASTMVHRDAATGSVRAVRLDG